MPWFWGSKKKDDDEDDEEYSTGSEYEDDDDDEYTDDDEEEEESVEGSSEEEEEDDDGYEDSVEKDDNEEDKKEGNETKDSPTTDDKPALAADEKSSNPEASNNNGIEDDYEMPMKPEEDEDEKEEEKAPLKRTAAPESGGVDLRSVRSAESISVGAEDISLIESDHDSSHEFLDTDDDDDDDEDDADGDSDQSKTEDDVEAADDDLDDDDEDESSDEEEEETDPQSPVRVTTVENDDDDSDDDDDDDDDEKEEVTSFWEKQSLLVLAAEHDRVDILKAILTEEDEDREALMSSGIPPLHISISFGSTNATQSLLRMGADPSIRPNVAEIKKQQQQQAKANPEQAAKVEIPNMQRFDQISAWELAFGNQLYEEFVKSNGGKASKSWSLFGKSSSTLGDSNSQSAENNNTTSSDHMIKPVDMAPSKREGIRHAFTAESLRCIGGDEKERLRQLLDSGMPPSIDIGGKDLYGWAVEMGAMQCEELLRPVEAAKHGQDDDKSGNPQESVNGSGGNTNDEEEPSTSSLDPSFRILDRPTNNQESSVRHLINRLDELESLATALSTCLDNLAEEVSVCHGLLLMGGGASALASHVKSLKNLIYQKAQQLVQAQEEWEAAEQELATLLEQAGPDVAKQVPANLGIRKPFSRTESFMISKKQQNNGDEEADNNDNEDKEAQHKLVCQLKAQIAASDNKVRKLRTSIADLSDENTREMKEVEKRGLSGGVELVRGLREELRDTEFQLSEIKSSHASCRAKINWIHNKLGNSSPQKQQQPLPFKPALADDDEGAASASAAAPSNTTAAAEKDQVSTTQTSAASNTNAEVSKQEPKATPRSIALPGSASPVPRAPGSAPRSLATKPALADTITPASERIAKGDSQALAVRPTGTRGYFSVDLWQVLLRIIGFDRAAARRGVQVAQQQSESANLMIV